MKIAYLDGRRLYRVLYAGIQNIMDRQDYLNKINVFPVPDGDTGTNMAYTLMGIAERMRTHLSLPLGDLSQEVANAAIDNARGNSGAILAQFFQGFAEAVMGKAKLSTTQFAEAVSLASQSAYQALSHPREGTILSVIKTWAACLKDKAHHYRDYLTLMEASLAEAQEALRRTPEQLAVLKKAGVVDAAGQGFVDILEGMLHFIRSGNLRHTQKLELSLVDALEQEDVHPDDLNLDFPFCTECVLTGEGFNRQAILAELEQHGDSVVVAGSPQHMKVHLHTLEPGKVFNHLRSLGQLSQQKVDDMRIQKKAAADPNAIALVVDSTCDLPDELFDRFQIHTIPVRLNFGDDEFIDKITISGDEFYQRLLTDKHHPKTSQPPLGDVRRIFKFLSSHYSNLISIHVPRNSSGTLQGIEAGLKEVEFKNKAVFDGFSLSIGTGLIVIEAGAAIEAGDSFENVVRRVENAVQNTEVFIGLDSMDAVFRGGRVSDKKKKLVEALHLNPILTMNKNGFVESAGVTFGRRNKFEKFTRFVLKKIGNRAVKRIGVVHAVNPEAAQVAVETLKSHFQNVSIYQSTVGPALGVHAGRKAIGIAVQFA
ncbi:MAG: DegV family EDD domain-containing protein [Lentisphaeria bacterium]|nr:DegV family EDD domain-containing protein [Candidatus Neomarinimicrobiota bacterium]MCF7841895.1 DegV family EDD domain-containing protein [Lentisphaeria bacterium]